MASRFDQKVVMVTGAAGSVARGVLDVFAEEGAKIALLDVKEDRLKAVVDDMGDKLGDHIISTADIGNPGEIEGAIQKTVKTLGNIDILVHTAGGFAMGDPVHALNMEAFDRMFYLNTRLTYVTCGAVAGHMIETGTQGAIVTILAKAGLSGAKNMGAYTASKAAAERIVQSMAHELKDHGVRINGIMPSIVDTEPNRKDMPNADFSKWVTPRQIGETAAFLASSAASAISGASVPVYNQML